MYRSAEVLCVGTELLLGSVVNTNATEISRVLAQLGIPLYRHTVVGDNPERLAAALRESFDRADLVILTGGLGPTFDDLTKETVARYFGRELVCHEESRRHMEAFFARLNRPMDENNRKQAMMPQGSRVLANPNGTAPGVLLEDGEKCAILLPGPPGEMAAMLRDAVTPYLREKTEGALVSRSIHFFGIGESALEAQLPREMKDCENPTVAPYAKAGEVMLRVTAKAVTERDGAAMVEPVVERICRQFSRYVYGVDTESLENTAVLLLREKGLTVATAESCTGGLVAKRLTDVQGSSDVLGYGVTTYANEAKEKLLGVCRETLEQHGAVSPQTALEMARGVRRLSGADIGLSVTGIAGPGGGSAEKPVGLVYIGISCEAMEQARERRLSRGGQDERGMIRYLAASSALHLLLKAAERSQKQ